MNYFDLIRSALLIGLRNLSRNGLASFISISGLAIAIGCVITVFIFIDMQLNLDAFHSNRNRIYQIVSHVSDEEKNTIWGDSPLLIGPQIKMDHSIIEKSTRIKRSSGNVRFGDDIFSENLTFVDPTFFEIFDFPILSGDRGALNKKEYIVLSRDIAIKYFGDANPLGKELSIKFSNGKVKLYTIGLVLDHYPANTSFEPDFYLSIESYFDLEFKKFHHWSDLADATFVLINETSLLNDLEQVLDDYKLLHNRANSNRTIEGFELISLNQLATRSYEIQGSITNSSMPSERITLVVIAFLLLTMACFNYINIAVTSVTKRLKEIALRKVFGGVRKHIIVQFLSENLILSLLAVCIGLLLSYFLFLPGLDSVAPDHIPFQFSSVSVMITFFHGLVLLVTLASGMYPALYISRFLPVAIFQGSQRFGSRKLFGKVLLCIQFFIAFITIVGSFVFTDNGIYLSKKSWGYNPDGLISIPMQDNMQYDQLRNLISSHPQITKVAGSFGHIGYENNLVNIDHLGKTFRAFLFLSQDQYLETMNLTLSEGRFPDDSKLDQSGAAVVNQQFVKKMAWTNPLNQTFTYDGHRRTVVGVVENFHTQNFYQPLLPVLFIGSRGETLNYLTIKCNDQTLLEVDAFARIQWQSIFPDDPYVRIFQSDVFDGFYRDNQANVTVMIFISILAMILASLGLYGLVSLEVYLKIKEFCIRKVMGAKSSDIILLANRHYLWILSIAFLVGAPLGYYLINTLIGDIYPNAKDVSWLPFILSILVVVSIVLITVGGRIKSVLESNPSEILRGD
ncbi:MAG: ABC transporter permease [Cyclobacteriaceae bacterium]